MNDQKLSGHCYCGTVSFEIEGGTDWVGHCHCESCRRASGSVMTTYAEFKSEQVIFTGEQPQEYTRGDGVTRGFCGKCGSPVSYHNAGEPGLINIQLGLFDDINLLPAHDHSFRNEKADWLVADEHLPDSPWVNPSNS